MKVYGPYLDSKGTRRIVIRVYEDGTRETTSHARYLLETHLGHPLKDDEDADHIDGDPLNDDLSNLQVLPKREHVRKTRESRPVEMEVFVCPMCGQEAVRRARDVRWARKQGKAGPFCGKSCAGKYKPL